MTKSHALTLMISVPLLVATTAPGAQPYAMPPGWMPPAQGAVPGAAGAAARPTLPAESAYEPYGGMAHTPAAQASQVLGEGMNKLLDFLRQEEMPNQLQVAAFLDREIAPYFDFEYMAQWVAGPAFATLSDTDKAALVAYLEADFLSTLTTQLVRYQNQEIRVLTPRMGPRGAVSVNVAVMRAGAYPTRLEFRMYQSDGRWRVYDVVADGQSAAAYYRVQFQRLGDQGLSPAPIS